MEIYKMKLADFDKWLAEERAHNKVWQEKHPDFDYERHLQEKLDHRAKIHEKFPFFVTVEAFEPVLSYAARWCWQNFGPLDGFCLEFQEEYPACPLVLATKYTKKGSYTDHSTGKLVEWEEEAYKKVEDHSHEGVWKIKYIDKVGYDYFVCEYCFLNEKDKNLFVEAIPSFDEGEKYRKE